MIDQEKIVEFVSSTGLFMAAIDGKIDPVEMETLKKSLSNFSIFKARPEKYLYFNSMETLQKRTKEICAYVVKLSDSTKNFLLGFIIGIALSDEKLHRKEKKSLYEIAEWIEISKENVDKIIEMGLFAQD